MLDYWLVAILLKQILYLLINFCMYVDQNHNDLNFNSKWCTFMILFIKCLTLLLVHVSKDQDLWISIASSGDIGGIGVCLMDM